jgi:hypothetical protein
MTMLAFHNPILLRRVNTRMLKKELLFLEGKGEVRGILHHYHFEEF